MQPRPRGTGSEQALGAAGRGGSLADLAGAVSWGDGCPRELPKGRDGGGMGCQGAGPGLGVRVRGQDWGSGPGPVAEWSGCGAGIGA